VKKHLPVFNQKKAKALLSFCKIRTDYLIKLKKNVKEKEKEVL
jgi:hypothetical protein